VRADSSNHTNRSGVGTPFAADAGVDRAFAAGAGADAGVAAGADLYTAAVAVGADTGVADGLGLETVAGEGNGTFATYCLGWSVFGLPRIASTL
jgi:hypothetical protein